MGFEPTYGRRGRRGRSVRPGAFHFTAICRDSGTGNCQDGPNIHARKFYSGRDVRCRADAAEGSSRDQEAAAGFGQHGYGGSEGPVDVQGVLVRGKLVEADRFFSTLRKIYKEQWMFPFWDGTTCARRRKVFHCPQLPQTFKNSRVPPSYILNRHRSWHPKMRKVQFFPSSKLCSACGALAGPGWAEVCRCAECGAVHQRDDNAAVNLSRYPDSGGGTVGASERRGAGVRPSLEGAAGGEATKLGERMDGLAPVLVWQPQ